jgi:hypothetical protein
VCFIKTKEKVLEMLIDRINEYINIFVYIYIYIYIYAAYIYKYANIHTQEEKRGKGEKM